MTRRRLRLRKQPAELQLRLLRKVESDGHLHCIQGVAPKGFQWRTVEACVFNRWLHDEASGEAKARGEHLYSLTGVGRLLATGKGG